MKLTVQNMVCPRCVESVREVFAEERIPVRHVSLGTVITEEHLDGSLLDKIDDKLIKKGFGLVKERERELIEKMKVQLIEYVQHLETSDEPKKLSAYVSGNLHYNYSYLSKLFSNQMGETVETYLIRLKIERVKELLGYRRFTLSEIAWRLKYSSVQYLSNQFKKVTGKTVTAYLSQVEPERNSLDHI